MFLVDAAMAQTTTTAGTGAGGGDIQSWLAGPLPLMLAMFLIGYFLLFRPQQQRMKQHQAMVAGLKRGDQVVLNSGVIGKVTRVDDAEATLEIAQGVNIKVVKSMISEVRTRGEPAPANDSKS
jgi:preprotein translocase subunit YajC